MENKIYSGLTIFPKPYTPCSHEDNRESGGSTGGGGDTQSRNFKKKFSTFYRAVIDRFDGHEVVGVVDDGIMNPPMYDEEILPTKTYDGVKVSSLSSGLHIYFIEDENNALCYGDFSETGVNEWVPLNQVVGQEFSGVISHPNETRPNSVSVLIYYVEAEDE